MKCQIHEFWNVLELLTFDVVDSFNSFLITVMLISFYLYFSISIDSG